jgi:hypothetical protein
MQKRRDPDLTFQNAPEDSSKQFFLNPNQPKPTPPKALPGGARPLGGRRPRRRRCARRRRHDPPRQPRRSVRGRRGAARGRAQGVGARREAGQGEVCQRRVAAVQDAAGARAAVHHAQPLRRRGPHAHVFVGGHPDGHPLLRNAGEGAHLAHSYVLRLSPLQLLQSGVCSFFNVCWRLHGTSHGLARSLQQSSLVNSNPDSAPVREHAAQQKLQLSPSSNPLPCSNRCPPPPV